MGINQTPGRMLLRGLEILSMEPGSEPTRGSIRIDDGRITAIGTLTADEDEETLDLAGLTALPGFVQGHVHLCQTLFRGRAEDLALLEWLERRIWPLEAAHDEESLRVSARIGLAELARGGCTTFQSMETTHGTEFVFDEVLRSGQRAVIGNAMMDSGGGKLSRSTAEVLDTSLRLKAEWDGRKDRIHYAFNPRFLLSCSKDLLTELGRIRASERCRIHTHAAEHPKELDQVLSKHGKPTLLALADLDLLGETTSLAHCVHLSDEEMSVLEESRSAVLHCPTTNLKLGSGIAPVSRYLEAGIRVAIGSDGAPANNRLDALTELRQAALLAQLESGPGSLTPRQALEMLTIEGARALGLEERIGSLAPGKEADLVIMDLGGPFLQGDVHSRIVYAADRSHIRHVLSAGAFLVRDGSLLGELADSVKLQRESDQAIERLVKRAAVHST
ncbi:MAG: amidohydrolase family protein [Planctomycetota bacterium]